MNLQTLPGLFISHGSPMLALNPEQVGPALSRLSVKFANTASHCGDVGALGK